MHCKCACAQQNGLEADAFVAYETMPCLVGTHQKAHGFKYRFLIQPKGRASICYCHPPFGDQDQHSSWRVISFQTAAIDGITRILKQFKQVTLFVIPGDGAIAGPFCQIDIPRIFLTRLFNHYAHQRITTRSKVCLDSTYFMVLHLLSPQFKGETCLSFHSEEHFSANTLPIV